MDRTFTLEEARDLLAEVRPELDRLVEVRADLATRAHAHNAGEDVSIPDIKAAEAAMGEILDGIKARGIHIAGYAPLLLDFPVDVGDRVVLACWLESEPSLAWYHELTTGFMARRRLEELPIGDGTGR